MATWIITAKLTAHAIAGLMERPEDRRAALDSLVAAAGGDLTEYYFTTGEMDLLMIMEAEGAETCARVAMVMAQAGMVADTRSMRAWTTVEYAEVCREAAGMAGSYRAPGS